MKNHAAEVVSDEAFAKRAEKWTADVPDTKEAYFIRDIFDGKFLQLWEYTWDPLTVLSGLFPSEAAAKTAVRYVY